ncbi:MAG: orotate phosphoribosyltransferase [Bacteroidales bacterium]|jgi:orotate phosphoribosyltransferase|nr:orotate phosphoribosyltransferase [Bacteroidales bacterium]MDY0315305.1 orotate phosphoribosyltransferase [Bacteroidales bacterium]NLB85533.1 orotate phosphoribosyltransferase [Bacteroidales bacterium]
MNQLERQIAEKLLQIKAIKLQPANHFTWASGWFSPIYCDNRKTLSFPEFRTFIKEAFVKIIKEKFEDFDVIAGVATGAIAQGVLVADAMNKPFVYVRPQAKEHGMGNKIEGHLDQNKKVLIIEDLISTGGSSLSAVKAIREANCEVVGMAAIFTYNFQKAIDNFANENVKLITLSNYDILIETAIRMGYVSNTDLNLLKEWRLDPANWKK